MKREPAWYCNKCHSTFDELKLTHDGGYWEEPFYVCPYCGSDDYQIAEWCEKCEYIVPQSKIHHGLCEDCLETLAKEYGRDFIMSDEDLFEEFAWWMYKKRRKRGET